MHWKMIDVDFHLLLARQRLARIVCSKRKRRFKFDDMNFCEPVSQLKRATLLFRKARLNEIAKMIASLNLYWVSF